MAIVRAKTANTKESKPGDPLGDFKAELISDTAGLTQFGAFLEELAPGAWSSLPHWHSNEDEFVLIQSGAVTLTENGVQTELLPGDAACWKAGTTVAHCLFNHTDQPATYLVVGTRAVKDRVTYPEHDRILYLDRAAGTRRYTTLSGEEADAP